MNRVCYAAVGLLVVSACADDRVLGKPPYFAASADVVDFGEVEVGDTQTRSVFLINKGDLSMKLSPPTGALLEDVFSLVGMQEIVDPGGSISVRIFFSPVAEGSVEDEVVFPNDSANEPEFRLVVKGVGIQRDPCRELDCTSPPPRYCATSKVSKGYEPNGQCVEGKCEYVVFEETCDEWGCDEATGACAGDPCKGVSCVTPPARYCDGFVSRGFAPAGECVDGACQYAPVQDDCPYGCVQATGECRPDPCAGVVCQTPPDRICASVDTTRTFNPAGSCQNGECVYVPVDSACTWGCEAATGACAPDPCIGVECQTPPARRCVSEGVSRWWSQGGQCAAGECVYTATDDACAWGCNEATGACHPDPCLGVTCRTPPARECLSDTVSRRFNANGVCSNGECSYSPVEDTCQWGCNDATGACQPDPCIGLACQTPPTARCVSSTKSRIFDPDGTCANGICTYSPLDENCQWGCDTTTGYCKNDPCATMTCQSPPARYCLNADTSRGFPSTGLCSAGQCDYAPIDTACQWGCNADTGGCNPDPCLGVTCQTPPNSCFFAAGTCHNGVCQYPINNGASCSDGDACTQTDKCVSGVCTGTPKICTQNLPDTCVTSTQLRQYEKNGVCNPAANGACIYPTPTDISCAYGCETVGGVGRCKGNPCETPYDDGNACTVETCDPLTGWRSSNIDNINCTVPGASSCKSGTCGGGVCHPKGGTSCAVDYDSLCDDVTVPGTCTSDGQCLPNSNASDPCWQDCESDTVFCFTCYVVYPWIKFPICIR